ncbi:MAG: Kdo hydroxylase family protein [Alphaproteobacteria bacterium]|nr:Kdo hydroxylase family protein [Alphaproteobacteria bacterium]MBL6937373.1 Kdo hydroxylase family protein [Alphaproteobacteria bacterium]MBL7096065.1 Kdo hydroxylase family protein [Alphaproteobacteria bacterium]
MTLDPIATFEDIARWTGPFRDAQRAAAQDALESGKVLFFPRLSFVIGNSEATLLTDQLSNGRAKNISRDPDGRVQGERGSAEESVRLNMMLGRFAEHARALVMHLFPGYAARVEQARTSYRPVEIAGRRYSPRDDDKRLHLDAFPSRPQRGRRILRVFSNIHPMGGKRVWHVGEPFEDVARRYASKARKPLPLEPWLFETLGITRGRRSEYDYLMLGLHDGAKLDTAYQKDSPQVEFAFPAGTTWMCFTDQAMHAALSGQFALEQTFHLPVEALAHPERSPLKVLERMMGRTLV